MDKIFSSKPGRKQFLLAIGSLLMLLLVIRFAVFRDEFFLKPVNDVANSFIDKFFTSIFTAVFVGLFLYWIQGIEKKTAVEFTKSKDEIEAALSAARKNTETWLFSGGLGRYTRGTTIPAISDAIATSRKSFTFKIITLNPFNDHLINEYCQFRLSFEPKAVKKWNSQCVRAEIFACIFTAVLHRSRNRLLDLYIAIKDYFTLSRMDISAEYAIITREDPTIPSLILKKGSHLYNHYIEEYNHTYRHSHLLSNYFMPLQDPLTIEEIKKCIVALFPNEIMPTEADFWEMVLNKVLNPEDPF